MAAAEAAEPGASVLVVFATSEGHTKRIAERVAEYLSRHGHKVDVAPVGAGVDPAAYDGVVVGASVHYGHHPGALARALRAARMPTARTAFFSVSLGAKERYATRFLRKARWQPQLVAVFPGALKYSMYGPLKRLVVRIFAAIAGHDTDTSRDYEYTDWQAVERFAEQCARAFSVDKKKRAA